MSADNHLVVHEVSPEVFEVLEVHGVHNGFGAGERIPTFGEGTLREACRAARDFSNTHPVVWGASFHFVEDDPIDLDDEPDLGDADGESFPKPWY